MRTTMKFIFTLSILLLGSIAVWAQTFPPATSCTSKDLELISATLPPPANNPCQCDGTRQLILGIRNKTGSTRTAFALWGTLNRYDATGTLISSTAIFACASTIVANTDNFLPATSGTTTITVSCGQSLEIVNLYLAWTSANGNQNCDYLVANSSTINPKCGTLPSIKIGLGVAADFVVTNATCSANGSIKVSPNGGVAPYKVKIGTDERTNIAAGGSTTFSLPGGTYSILITDSRGCTNTQSRTIGSSSAPSVSGIGGSFTKTCTQNPSGATIGETPVSGFSYSWAPTTGLSNANIGNPTANPSATTIYTVTKTDNSTGCSNTAQVTVTVNQTIPDVSGIGGGFTKTCTQNLSGGVIGENPVSGFGYLWTPTTGLSNANIGNPTANPSVTTKYTVTKTSNTNGCFATADVTVTVDQSTPDITGIGGAFTITCTQNTSGGVIGETPVNGYTYVWTPTTGLSNPNIGNPTATPASTTTYQVTKANSSNGCSAQTSVTVTVNKTQPNVSGIGGSFTKTCTQNTSGATIGETPVSGFSYSWAPTTGLSNANIGNPTANPSATTTYTVTKIDNSNGCSKTAQVTVTVNTTAPTFTVCLVQPTLCANSGSVTITASGGSGFQYSIDNGAHYQNSNSFTGLASGSVTGIVVTNSDGCVSNTAPCDAASQCQQSGITSRELNLNSTALPANNIAVKAYPNPFNDRVKFVVNSPYTGDGSLEIYNLLGQKIKTVYQGHISTGNQNFEFSVPKRQQSTLIYIFRVGDKQVNGKLLQLNN